MRVWGKVSKDNGTGHTWEAQEGDRALLTWLENVLLLGLGEDPFAADWGIPYQQTFAQMVFPDFYVQQVRQKFSTYFPTISIAPSQTEEGVYEVNIQGTAPFLAGPRYGQAQ